ncbi:MAG: hypothetical protein WC627_00955 [Legionella sp.]|jgi:hypothetical protein
MELFTVRKENVDNNEFKSANLPYISFNKSVLDKYSDHSLYEIQLNENLGTIKSKNWSLPIDVGATHITTLLSKLQLLPQEEKDHFQANNIYPKEISESAYKRWFEGEF